MVDEIIGKILDIQISIDWECKTIDLESDHHCIFIEFDDLEEIIKLLEKIKIKIEEVNKDGKG